MAKFLVTAPKAAAPVKQLVRSHSATPTAPAQGLGGSYVSAADAVRAKYDGADTALAALGIKGSPTTNGLAGLQRLETTFEPDRMNGAGGGSVGKGTLTPQANQLAVHAAHVAEKSNPWGVDMRGSTPTMLTQQNASMYAPTLSAGGQAAVNIGANSQFQPWGVDKRNEPVWKQTLDAVAAKSQAGPGHVSQESIAQSMMPFYGNQDAADANAQWNGGGSGGGGGGNNGGQAMHDPNVFGPPVNAVQYARGLGGSYVPPTNFNSGQEASGNAPPPQAAHPELQRRPMVNNVYPGQ